MARPSEFTTEAAEAICEGLARGLSIRAICQDENMPSDRTVYRWLEANEEFRQQYARARERQADFYAAEIIEIADDGSRDMADDGDGGEVVDHDHIARARLRVDARKWYASKLAPKKYGDKVMNEHSGPDGKPMAVNVTRIEIVAASVDSKD